MTESKFVSLSVPRTEALCTLYMGYNSLVHLVWEVTF